MAERVERVTEVVDQGGGRVKEVSESHVSGQALAARIIWYVAGVILALLAIRFILALLGANPSNAFANFIYDVSHPLVAPFFSLFGYNLQYGVSKFETYTLVAMLIYALIAWGLARLVTLNNPRPEV